MQFHLRAARVNDLLRLVLKDASVRGLLFFQDLAPAIQVTTKRFSAYVKAENDLDVGEFRALCELMLNPQMIGDEKRGRLRNKVPEFKELERLLLESDRQVERPSGISSTTFGRTLRDVSITGDKNDLQKLSGIYFVFRRAPDSSLSSTVGSEAWNSRDLKSRPH